MWEKITKKDIIGINREFDEGRLVNNSSLEFAIFQANKSRSWLRSCALLIRAVLIDHVFKEANKRTSAGIIVYFFEDKQVQYNPEDVAKVITEVLMKNITSLTKIERLIKNVIST